MSASELGLTLPLSEHLIDTLLVTDRQIVPAPICIFSELECDQSQELTLAFGE